MRTRPPRSTRTDTLCPDTTLCRSEISLGPEHILTAGLARATGYRAKTVAPPCDGRDEALLRLHIGRDRPEQRWLLLIGTVCAAEPLDRSIGFPACFEQIMDAAALVRGAKIEIGRAHV